MAELLGQQATNEVKAPAFFAVLNNAGEVVLRGPAVAGGIIPQMILPPNQSFTLQRYAPSVGSVYEQRFVTGAVGSERTVTFSPLDSRYLPRGIDSDGDGLDDITERIIGTSPFNPDSDGDGIPDGAEVEQGTNPLDGRPVVTGVIASVATPGTAKDVYAQSGVAVVAAGSAGVIVFSTANSANPVRVAQVGTPGDAMRVAGSGNLIAVADGAAGLVVVDVSTPSQARIVQQVALGGSGRAVAAAAGLGFVGTDSGQLVSVDLASGTIVARVNAGAIVHDIALGGDALLVLAGNELRSYRYDRGGLQLLGTAAASAFIPEGITGARRLFVGAGIAYATSYPGYDTFSVTNPAPMARLGIPTEGSFNSFKQIVANGSGLGLVAVGVNPRNDGTHNISLYDVSDPAETGRFITTLATPGTARALSIYNGLAYVADSEAGLEVMNYLAYDTGTNPPTIALSASFPLTPATVEEGKIARVTAQVTDDVQVRNVEFYIDGQRVATDGNFQFEYRFVTPPRVLGRTNFTMQARAFDTGGNATWSTLLTVAVVLDATPPEVAGTFPANAAILGALTLVSVNFNEPINPATLSNNSFCVSLVGPDGLPGTADDVFIPGGTIAYNTDARVATLTFPTNLAPGAYAISVKQPAADLAGNIIAAPFISRFWIEGGIDSDQDGIPDDIEILLGYDPHNPDSLGDGIWDGDRDFDGDGLKNSWEILWGYNPMLADSDNSGVPNGLKDPDHDGLNNLQEQAAGTNPTLTDSDGDGWSDETEISGGSNPLDPASKPKLFFVSSPPAALAVPIAPVRTGSEILAFGALVANPPAALAIQILPSAPVLSITDYGGLIALPPAALAIPLLPAPTALEILAFGALAAAPPAALSIPSIPLAPAISNTNYGSLIASPPAQLQISTQ